MPWTRTRENKCLNPRLTVDNSSWVKSIASFDRVATPDLPGFSFDFGASFAGGTLNVRIFARVANLTPGLTYPLSTRIKRTGALHSLIYSSTTGTGGVEIAAPAAGSGWEEVVGSLVASQETMYIGLKHAETIAATPTETHMTGVMVGRPGDATGFFDGDTPASPGKRYGWDGVARASTAYEETYTASSADSLALVERDYLQKQSGNYGLLSLADLQRLVYGDDPWAYFSPLSGLTPAEKYTTADHAVAYYRAQLGVQGGSLADLERAFWQSRLLA